MPKIPAVEAFDCQCEYQATQSEQLQPHGKPLKSFCSGIGEACLAPADIASPLLPDRAALLIPMWFVARSEDLFLLDQAPLSLEIWNIRQLFHSSVAAHSR